MVRLHRADAGVGLVEIVFNAKHAPVLRCPDCVLHSCHVLAECLLPLLSLLERGHLANPKHTALPSFAKQITDDCVLADKSIEPKDGKVVIAAINGEMTVKRLSVVYSQMTLPADKREYPDVKVSVFDESMLWGVVTNFIHQL